MAKKNATKAKKETTPKTTAQQLGSLIKSARDIMRKDKGLNGDLDRLPLLTWVMFLKFLDDREKLEEARAGIGGKKYKSAVDAPYRWRDWAADKDGITGDELIAFVNQDEATRPDGTKGPGLLAYLQSLQATADDRRRGVIATVFNGVNNRMLSGYLLRDVINLVDGIHFDSTDEIHTLARLYESMLREMRDAAGDSGEFYTPRPVVQFMVKVINPQLGEVVLDPACGTGGFLTEAFEHLEKQCSTVQHRKILQENSIHGGEAKPLPYMLAQMNLLLHGLDAPAIEYGNSLTVKIMELGAKDRVDLILTNPPFGGEEEVGIRNNFPADLQTSETTLLFLQLIMRRLRISDGGRKGGRAAVIVPNGTLYESGVAMRIREKLVKEFSLHTVVRLPKGVFEPYTDIATNILFFDRAKSSGKVWFYEHPLPAHRAHLKGKSYSRTDPIQFEEFLPIVKWWNRRRENDFAWSVPIEKLEESNFDLALIHPKHEHESLPSPRVITETIGSLRESSDRLLRALESTLMSLQTISAPKRKLSELIEQRQDSFEIVDDEEYIRPRVKLHFKGAVVRDRVEGRVIGTKRQTRIFAGDLLLSRIDARNGAMAIATSEVDSAIATNDFPVFSINTNLIVPAYLRYCLFQPSMLFTYEKISRGSTNRRRLNIDQFLELTIPVPQEVDEQFVVADTLSKAEGQIAELKELLDGMGSHIQNLVSSSLHYVFK